METIDIEGLTHVTSIDVGALAGPSDTILLRIGRSEPGAESAVESTEVFLLSHEQVEDLVTKLRKSLRWIDEKPFERFH
ncbi:hypothetical protein CAL29_14970 [Bordetella genomosp. 10]|uniref:Uncharacterized protein n=1 Tax=Bordetella genomosp. 10 TaxID=1416804 RepID=A0A261SBJ2_9BORD|nr:hypothetical protein [Bordetella genomosp. 10]OZI34769.1 hypothetical protein CAL29_14970 [Bordetella genomosp. 10]